MRIEVIKKKAGWYWRVVARNGRVMCHSEQYYSKANAHRAAKMFRRDMSSRPYPAVVFVEGK